MTSEWLTVDFQKQKDTAQHHATMSLYLHCFLAHLVFLRSTSASQLRSVIQSKRVIMLCKAQGGHVIPPIGSESSL